MAKTIKIKVKSEKDQPFNEASLEKKSHFSYHSDDGHPWESGLLHQRLEQQHELDLEPWLDGVAAQIVGTNHGHSKRPVVAVEIEEVPVITAVEIEEVASQPTDSGLSLEKQKAVEAMFFSKERQKFSPFEHEDREETEEIANPIIMLWCVIKEKIGRSFGERLWEFLGMGWWLVPVWFVGELWWLSREGVWAWPHGAWMAISWLWPLVCWLGLGWLRSNYAITVKDFLLSLWPLAAGTAIGVAVVEIAWLGSLWSWLNLIQLPLFVLAVVAASAWLLVGLGRLNN
ncbi:MAG: hypothetical protein NTV81_04250 [Candidatus Komeilibacteria bacterium]|nr:hypothetical protein [Candidatus Komeilibacteria bacterium]